jgi:hypothetical protein
MAFTDALTRTMKTKALHVDFGIIALLLESMEDSWTTTLELPVKPPERSYCC